MKRSFCPWLRHLMSRKPSLPRRPRRPRLELEWLENRAVPTISISNATVVEGNFNTNGYFSVNITTNTPPAGVLPGAAGVTIVRRYQVSAGDPNVADPASGLNILVFAQPQANHNAGWLEFGHDGYLYIATGDGG